MNCKCSSPSPTFLLICLLQFLHANRTRTTLREGGEEKDVAGYWHTTSSQTLNLPCAYACSVNFILGLQGCFWIITGYKLTFFFPACLNFKVNPLFVLLLLFKVKQQNKSIANSLVQVSKLSISVRQCAYKAIFIVAVHLQAWKPCINPQLQWPLP